MNCTNNTRARRSSASRALSSGQAFFKWLSIVALIAAGGLGYCFLTAKKAHEAELAQLRAEHQQELAKQSEELEKLRSENKDIERLRTGGQELVKLRGEVAQLRTLQKEQQKIQTENQQLKATVQQFQQVRTENSTLQNQNQQLQGALAERANSGVCIGNLKQIEAAKATWALQMHKAPNEMPLDADLFGPGKYLPQKPVCPSGGVYTLGPVGGKPTCTAPGHAY
jgi:predicted RNase H-like nuclease (RuvC/YqgF family)